MYCYDSDLYSPVVRCSCTVLLSEKQLTEVKVLYYLHVHSNYCRRVITYAQKGNVPDYTVLFCTMTKVVQFCALCLYSRFNCIMA